MTALSNTSLSSAVWSQYRACAFRVFADPPFSLVLGEASPDLAALHAAHGVSHSALLTAWNPGGQSDEASRNASRQAALLASLARRSLTCLPALIRPGIAGATPEQALLVLGIDEQVARALASTHGQSALLWCPGNTPELLPLH
jgi:hypothetical protein